MLKYKQTSISITNDGGFSTISNEIRYTISADLTDAVEVQELFPGLPFKVVGNQVKYNGIVLVPNMYAILEQFTIQESDMNKPVEDAIKIWAVNLIYQLNLFELNLNDWSIND